MVRLLSPGLKREEGRDDSIAIMAGVIVEVQVAFTEDTKHKNQHTPM